MHAAFALVAAIAAANAGAQPGPARLGPCGPIDRRYESVEQRVLGLRRLGGTPITKIGLVAYRDGVAHPIPFQVDERGEDGLAVDEGSNVLTTDDEPGILDADDQLVFMPCDAGERAPDARVDRRDRREIVLDDPITKATAWVYVVVADDPPRTDRRYVDYEPGVDLVKTAVYRIGMVNTLPRYFAVALAGPFGPNLLDGARLRAEATLKGSLMHWTQDEDDGIHEMIGWRAGPVRVVRRTRHKVELGMGIHLTAGVAHTYFYPQHVYGPGSLKLPFSPSVFFKDINGFGGADFRDLRGWRLLGPGTPPHGFRIDGRMTALEKAFAAKPPRPASWFALTREGEALVVVLTMSEELAKTVPLELVYLDDERHAAPPEEVAGSVPLVGMRGRDVQNVEAGSYRFQIRAFTMPGFAPGMERALLEQLARPVNVFVSVPAWLAAERAAGQ
jgi:hypothetical protein